MALNMFRFYFPAVLYGYFIYMTTETIDYDKFVKKTSFVSFLWVYSWVGWCVWSQLSQRHLVVVIFRGFWVMGKIKDYGP